MLFLGVWLNRLVKIWLVHQKHLKFSLSQWASPLKTREESDTKKRRQRQTFLTKTVPKKIVCSCGTSLLIHRSCLWEMINYKPKEQHMYMYGSVHMWPYTSTTHRHRDFRFGFSLLPGNVHSTGSWNVNVENWLSRTLGVLCYEMSAFGCSVVMRHTSQLLSFSQTDLRQRMRNKCHPWLPTVTGLILYLLQSPLLKINHGEKKKKKKKDVMTCLGLRKSLNQRQNSLLLVRAPWGEQKILWLNQ